MRIQNKELSTKQLKSMIKAACLRNQDDQSGAVSESSHLLAVETRSSGQYTRMSPERETA